ncbi:glycine oxidase ThiO [Rubrobacter indicoceani]|uniref:glycine oxidase ThiO n=1 Tax=Rubrobacter indicoceani TaxID=2051957 RepID=UPI0013C476B1|nr:glycine oxidase ThiO [Rubrobacter indicoceani]
MTRPALRSPLSAPEVAIVGGGIIGVSVAYYAAKRGASVALFEAGTLSSGASGAAAGMLNAQAEAHSPGAMLDLMLRSREMHHDLGPELYEATGLDPEHVWAGTLRIAMDDEFAARLKKSHGWQTKRGLAAKLLSGDDARSLEAHISDEALAGLFLPDDGQVNPRRLVAALAFAARRNGAYIAEHTPVRRLILTGDAVGGVVTDAGEVSAGCVVLAGGFATGALLAPLGVEVPVFPVRGETVTLGDAAHHLGANVWDAGCYIVPKRDGRVVIGATEDPGNPDRRPTLGGVSQLSSAAVKLLPGLSDATFSGAWGGLRPGTPDESPILGGAGGPDGLLLATGTYRNGILLSPAVGASVAALAVGEEPETDLSPFALSRFSELSGA